MLAAFLNYIVSFESAGLEKHPNEQMVIRVKYWH